MVFSQDRIHRETQIFVYPWPQWKDSALDIYVYS